MAQHDDKKDEAAVREAKRLQALIDAELETAVRDLASTRQGRIFLFWLLEIGKVNVQPFTNNALSTSFNCGELNVGMIIQARIIEADPAIYVRLLQENQNDRAAAQRASAVPESGSPGGYSSPDIDD